MTVRSLIRHVVFAAFAIVVLPVQFAMADAKSTQVSQEKYDLSRIVSIGGDVTEILYELGLENNIVAIDTTSQYPSNALKTKRNVGYMRALSSEGVLSTKPTVILASKGAGPPEVISALKSTSIPFVEITDEASSDAVYEKIGTLAKVTNKGGEGRALQDRVRASFEKLAKRPVVKGKSPRVLFVLLAQNGRALVGGKTTVADALFKLAGLTNVASDITGFRPISNESALAMKPDVIITMRRSDEQKGQQAQAVAAVEGLRQTDAVKSGRILELDGAYMLGFGPRLPDAALELSEQVRQVLETG